MPVRTESFNACVHLSLKQFIELLQLLTLHILYHKIWRMSNFQKWLKTLNPNPTIRSHASCPVRRMGDNWAEAGFEPAISKLWTWRNDLLLHSVISIWRFLLNLNQWITDLQSAALPAWLRNHNWGVCGWEGYNPSIYSLLDTTLLMLHWLRLLDTVELLFLLERDDTQHVCLSLLGYLYRPYQAVSVLFL